MAGFNDNNTNYLHRTSLWSRQMKSLLLDELQANKFVRTLTDFPDGYTINIPSLGEATQRDFMEGAAIQYDSMDTGNFQFSFDQYKYSANAISEKFKRDSFYASDVLAAFVPRQHRVLMEGYETRVFAVANSSQTASDLNTINTGDHRFVGSGTSGALGVKDFARARYALMKANVPMSNLCAIVDPSAAYTLETQTNIVNNLSPMPSNERIMREGASSGFRFRFNIFGFDIYESNYLPAVGSETINSVSVTNGVANYFFSATPGDTLPWIGAWRQMPTVQSDFDMDTQQEKYLTICEYGVKIFRPENLVTILTSTSVVS